MILCPVLTSLDHFTTLCLGELSPSHCFPLRFWALRHLGLSVAVMEMMIMSESEVQAMDLLPPSVPCHGSGSGHARLSFLRGSLPCHCSASVNPQCHPHISLPTRLEKVMLSLLSVPRLISIPCGFH